MEPTSNVSSERPASGILSEKTGSPGASSPKVAPWNVQYFTTSPSGGVNSDGVEAHSMVRPNGTEVCAYTTGMPRAINNRPSKAFFIFRNQIWKVECIGARRENQVARDFYFMAGCFRKPGSHPMTLSHRMTSRFPEAACHFYFSPEQPRHATI